MPAPQTDPQFKLRLSAALRDRLADAAKLNKRSMNAEINARLEASFNLGMVYDEETGGLRNFTQDDVLALNKIAQQLQVVADRAQGRREKRLKRLDSE